MDKDRTSGSREMLPASLWPRGLCVRACAHLHVCDIVHPVSLRLCMCVCICISLPGTLSILTQKLCLHFHFSNPAGPSPNLPWQLLSTRQACSTPSALHPMPPRYAPDASQLVGCLCGASRLLETDARATVGACLRICVRGQPWALTVTFTAGRDSRKRVGSVVIRAQIKCHSSGPFVATSLRYRLTHGYKL